MESNQALLILVFYKIILAILGAVFVFMGYKLFIRRLNAAAGNVQTPWGKVTKAAPGTLFVIAGTAVIIYAISKGVIIKSTPNEPGVQFEILDDKMRSMLDSMSAGK